jgi:hypothetical protein
MPQSLRRNFLLVKVFSRASDSQAILAKSDLTTPLSFPPQPLTIAFFGHLLA